MSLVRSCALLIFALCLLFSFNEASITVCCDYRGCPRPCEISAPDHLQNSEVTFNVPSSGFVPNTNTNGCAFNCEWFVRTARRDDPSKPCTLQRGRNGKFRGNCVQEQVCTSCKTGLVMLAQPFYLTTSDTAARCPRFPEDLDAFTAEQLTTAKKICENVAKCDCVSGTIHPQVLSVRE